MTLYDPENPTIDLTPLQQQINSKVSQTDFEAALQEKAPNSALAEIATALEGKITSQQLGNFVDQELQEHLEADDPHPQYVLESDLTTALNGKADKGSTSSLGDPSNAIANPDSSTIDATYGAEESSVLSSMRTSVNAILKVLRDKNLIKTALTFSVSQSSSYNYQLVATYANMTDGDPATGAGTNNGASWVQVDFGKLITVQSVTVAGGSLPGWGGVAAYLNGSYIQTSIDGTNWTNQGQVSGVADSGASRFQTFNFTPITARYGRIYMNGYLSVTELAFA